MKTTLSIVLLLTLSISTLANDPFVKWGTYYYGNSIGSVTPLAVRHDGWGHIYMCGTTSDLGLGTPGTFQDSLLAYTGAFIAKFDTSGNLIWGTYYTNVTLHDIACDALGNIYVAGTTNDSTSNWIATPATHQPQHGGVFDAILAKFDSSGNRLWATYYGGELGEQGHSVSVSGSSVYLSGVTYSVNGIASVNGFQQSAGGNGDLFLARFDTGGNRIWGTFYGGEEFDGFGDNCTDSQGSIYLASGTTSATNIATPGSYQPAIEPNGDGFLVKFDSAGSRIWATYYGGEGPDGFSAVALGGDDNLYVLGASGTQFVNASTYNISTPGSYQPQPTAIQDPFIVKFTPGGQRIWGTYFGSIGNESGFRHGLCTDTWSNVYLVISVDSPGFPTLQPFQQGFGGQEDVVIAKFDSSGAYKWGSYYGGNNFDRAFSCTADNIGNVYFVGHTNSLDSIATPGSFIPVNANNYNSGFLVRIHDTTQPISVQGILSDERLMIYPNPVTEILSIESSLAGSGSLFNMDGKEIISFFLSKGRNDIAIPQQLSPGIYIISCRFTNGEILNRAIVHSK